MNGTDFFTTHGFLLLRLRGSVAGFHDFKPTPWTKLQIIRNSDQITNIPTLPFFCHNFVYEQRRKAVGDEGLFPSRRQRKKVVCMRCALVDLSTTSLSGSLILPDVDWVLKKPSQLSHHSSVAIFSARVLFNRRDG
jgi:hypothetical protein